MHRRSCIEALETRTLLASSPVAIRQIAGTDIARFEWNGQQVDTFAGRWMIKLDGYSGSLPEQQARAAGVVRTAQDAFRVTRFIGDGLFLVEGPKTMAPEQVEQTLARVPGFKYIVPDYRYEADAIPNDQFFGSLWGLHNTGQTGGQNDVDIDAVEAWNTSTGSNQVVIGISDTGVDYNHPDLNDNIWINPGEIPNNFQDDDLNGYVDDVRGFDFIFGDNDPMDESDHGSHVGGTAGAEGNNGQGITGVGWNVKLLPLKIGGAAGLSGAAGVAAMYYVYTLKTRANDAANVRAVNMSWGGPGFDPSMDFIISAHNTVGIMSVSSAGNGGPDFVGDNNDVVPHYPSSYAQPNMIAVANLTSLNGREISSNFGSTTVHLAAPGTNILSTIRVSSGQYAFLTGTSMASPHVAGAVAVLFSAAPNATVADVKNAIMQSVDPVPAFAGITVSGGRLNLNAALGRLATPVAPAAPNLAATSDTGISPTDNITRDTTPTFQGNAPAGSTVKLFANGVLVGQTVVPAPNVYSVTASEMADGVYNFTVTSTNAQGESPHSPPLSVTIDTVAPAPSGAFRYQTSPHSMDVAFGENVAHSVSDADFGVIDRATSAVVNHAGTYNNGTHTSNLLFPGNNVLADARYRLTVFASGAGNGINDVAGNAMAADATVDFAFMIGDATNDGRVNLDDFNILAANFGQSGRNFSQGDFDYSGNVNLNDFNLLAARFGQQLPPAAAPGSRATGSPLGGGLSKGPGDGQDPLDELLD